ncbi:MAG: transcription antitermination factor NusB [Chlamydiota bacterium]
MSLPQTKLREAVFYVIFSQDFLGETQDKESVDTIAMIMEILEMSRSNVRLAWERAELILEKKDEIDAILKDYVVSYGMDRISCVERNVLRLSTYELLFDKEIPEVVAIAEGMRLGRKFGVIQGANFINGVLDALYKNQQVLLTQ